MNSTKKLLFSVGWVVIAIAAIYGFHELRLIGTTWKNNAGFFRLIGLTLYCVVLIAAPVVMAILAWANRPKALYKKFGVK